VNQRRIAGGTLAFAFFVGCSTAPAPSVLQPNLPTIDYCTLVAHSADYANQIVRIRAIWAVGYEHSVLVAQGCPQGTWVDFSSQIDAHISKQVLKDLDDTQVHEVVVVGRFDAGSPPGGRQFGHLMCCEFQIELMAVESAKPAKYPDRPPKQ
jgi:hypothetical protein